MTDESPRRDLSSLYAHLGLSEEAIAVVESARALSPTRKSDGWAGSITVRGCNRKTGRTIPLDARTTELVRATQLNFDRSVVEFHAQPPKRKIRYLKNGARNVSFWRTHDFLVIREDSIDYEECGDEQKFLSEQSMKGSDLYRRDETGVWTAPAFRRDAASLGFGFKVFLPDSFDVTFVRNADYIRDYMWRPIPEEYVDEVRFLEDFVKSKGVISLDSLQQKFSVSATLFGIATQTVFVDWYQSLLCAPESAMVYATDVHGAIDEHRRKSQSPDFTRASIAPGKRLNWNGKLWQIIEIAGNSAKLVTPTHDLVTINLAAVVSGVATGEIVPHETTGTREDAARTLLETVSTESLEDALLTHQKLERYKAGDHQGLSERTVREWKKKAVEGQTLYGNPVLGLVHKNALKGNREPKADESTISLAYDVIAGTYEAAHSPTEHRSYAQYVWVCQNAHLTPVSKTTFNAYKKGRDLVEQTRARQGHKAAYQISGPATSSTPATPHNGDRVWEVAHIDHTLVDLGLISKIDNESLRKMWLTIMMDGHSRRTLALWLSAFAPSSISLLMIIRDCVRRWHRLPAKLVVDQGSEFYSVFFEVFLAKAGIVKLERGKSAPRAGSLMERLFGIADTTFTHQLFGNTKHNRLFRLRSKTHDPSIHAIWTPDDLAEELEHWAFDFYPNVKNTGIGETPRNRFERSLIASGDRSFTAIPYDENFLRETMPETPNGLTRKVRKGTIQIDHVSYRGLHQSINRYNGEIGRTRWEPYNPSMAFIELDGQWRELVCTNDLLRELSERQVKCSHFELSARLSKAKKTYRDVDPELIKLVERLEAKQSELIAAKERRAGANEDRKSPSLTQKLDTSRINEMPITTRENY